MDFPAIMHEYFRGERIESLYVIAPLGILCVAFGAGLLLTERSAFFVGVAVPFVVLGLALAGVGGSVGLRTSSQVAALEQAYQTNAATFVAEELPRMEKVNKNWPVYLTTWCVFAVVGLLLRFAVSRDWAHGLGIALVFFGGVGLLIDGFAERRAKPYTAALSALRG
ncbi:MAG: hypothetical protein JNL21_34985 [Myxococcales bacterium]|nr:hypothetical protein [Myxococcales bacterium]